MTKIVITALNSTDKWRIAKLEGKDPLKLSVDLYARLYGLHLKDFIFDKKGNPEDVILGTGVLELKALLDLLKGKKFSGPLTIEYEGEAANPATSLMKCAVNIK